MTTDPSTRRESGFKERTPLVDARKRVLDCIDPIDRIEHVPLELADGQVVGEPIEAARDVPGYRRAAMDGYAVRATDTFGASDRSPAMLEDAEEPGPNRAVRVHTGSEVPEGANAVVMIEEVTEIGGEIEVADAVTEGENVGDPTEDVAAGEALYEPGHRLRPSDLGMIKSTGQDEVAVRARPQVAVIPTGEELVQSDPAPGEVIETNGLTVSRLVDRWGGDATYRNVVTDDKDTLAEAIESDTDHDLIVTTGGSSVGERDLLPSAIASVGEMLVHGVSIKPGHPVGAGLVNETPVVMLPGYPVACIVNAVQFVRPAIRALSGLDEASLPTRSATLERKLPSEPGVRTFARVSLEEGDDDLVADPVRAGGSGILSSVALADGWVVVPESTEGYDAGGTVPVELWEWSP